MKNAALARADGALPRARGAGLPRGLVRWAAALLAAFVPPALAAWAEPGVALQMPPDVAYQGEPVELPPPEELPDCSLDLAALEQMALAGNPSLRRAAALVAAARGNAFQAGLPPNPSVGYDGQQLGSGGQAEQHGIFFSQEIVRGGKLALNQAVADRERERLEQRFEAQRLRVLTDVRIAFYQVLLAQRQIELTDNLIQISQGGFQAVDALFQADEVGRADVLQSQLETETAQILSHNARNRHAAAWQSLAAVIGQPDLAPQPLTGDATAPPRELDFDAALARLWALSPEIAEASATVSRARATLERERVEPTPNVDVQGLVNFIDNGIGGSADGGVAVSIPIPIFNQNQGAVARAYHELIAAQEALAQLELDLQNRLAPKFEQYANARNQVRRYQEVILPAAEEALDLTRTTYGAGETNYTALLTAQRTYSQMHLNYLDAVRSLRIAEAEIEGLLLSGSLSESGAAIEAVSGSGMPGDANLAAPLTR